MARARYGFSRPRLSRVLLPAALAAIVAASAVLTYDAVTSRPPAVGIAGEAKMQMLRDEHDIIADYVASEREARKLANAAADSEIARVRLAAQGEMRRQAHIAAADQAKQAAVGEARTAALRPAEAVPARGAGRATVAAPLPLAAAPVTVAQASPPQVAPAQVAEGPVRSRLRSLVSDVRRIPSLLQSAAGWVADAVPAPKLPSLPDLPLVRQFSASL